MSGAARMPQSGGADARILKRGVERHRDAPDAEARGRMSAADVGVLGRPQFCAGWRRTEIVGDGSAGWIGGVPNQANITMPWRCQPVGGACTLQNVSSCTGRQLEASLSCPDRSCNATHVRPRPASQAPWCARAWGRKLQALLLRVDISCRAMHVGPYSLARSHGLQWAV